MSMHSVPKRSRSRDDPAESVALGQLAGLMRVPPPLQVALAAARVGLQRMAPHDVLYRSGDSFESFFVVLSGLLKLAAVDDGGQEHVLAFVLSGEAAGLDGFQGGSHCVDATALDAVEVALVPFGKVGGWRRPPASGVRRSVAAQDLTAPCCMAAGCYACSKRSMPHASRGVPALAG
jgi:hypothetical protein